MIAPSLLMAGVDALTGGNAAGGQGLAGPGGNPTPQAAAPAPAPRSRLSVAGGMIRGALAATASAMAGPDASGNPRRGFGPILGGILSGAMTGLAAGANREKGEAGGGLAAAGRGYLARTGQLAQQEQQARQQKQQAIENRRAEDKLTLEKTAQARAMNVTILQGEHQDRMERIAAQTKDIELDRYKDEHQKMLDEHEKDIRDHEWVKVPNMSGFKTYDDEYQAAVARFPQLAKDEGFKVQVIRNPETGLYEAFTPSDRQVEINDPVYGKGYMTSAEAGLVDAQKLKRETEPLLQKYRLREAQLAAERMQLEIDKIKAGGGASEKDAELQEKIRHNKAMEDRAKQTPPTFGQSLGNLLHGREWNAPVTTETEPGAGAAGKELAGAATSQPEGTTGSGPSGKKYVVRGGHWKLKSTTESVE